MAVQIQILRGTTAENDSFTGAIGALTYDTEAKQLRIHDGTTQGGIPLPNEMYADCIVDFQEPTPDNNYTWYRKYKSGWVEQGGLVDLPAAPNDGSLVTISFPVVMANSSYYFSPTMLQTRVIGGAYYGWQIESQTTTNISLRGYNTNARPGTSWEVKGMAAN